MASSCGWFPQFEVILNFVSVFPQNFVLLCTCFSQYEVMILNFDFVKMVLLCNYLPRFEVILNFVFFHKKMVLLCTCFPQHEVILTFDFGYSM